MDGLSVPRPEGFSGPPSPSAGARGRRKRSRLFGEAVSSEKRP